MVLVDDQLPVRAGVRALLDRAEDIEVVGEAADAAARVAAVRSSGGNSGGNSGGEPAGLSDVTECDNVLGGRVALSDRPSSA